MQMQALFASTVSRYGTSYTLQLYLMTSGGLELNQPVSGCRIADKTEQKKNQTCDDPTATKHPYPVPVLRRKPNNKKNKHNCL